MDDRLKKIHKHVENPDSSPAYLGRNFYSSDRKKQYDYLDKALKIPKSTLENP